MKRAAISAVLFFALGCFAGCERSNAANSYDPTLDGVNPPAPIPTDMSILDNQKELAAKASGSATPAPAAPAPVATTSAPATNAAEPATAPETPAPAADQTTTPPPPPG